MTTHTPGPWTIGPDLTSGRFGGPTIRATGTLAVVISGSGRAEANARLIAASPDLLAALQELEILTRSAFPHGGAVWKAQQQSRAAIAKATGTNDHDSQQGSKQ